MDKNFKKNPKLTVNSERKHSYLIIILLLIFKLFIYILKPKFNALLNESPCMYND